MFSKRITSLGYSPCSQVNSCWSQEELLLKRIEKVKRSRAPTPASSRPQGNGGSLQCSLPTRIYFLPTRPRCVPEISLLYVLVSSHCSYKKWNCIAFLLIPAGLTQWQKREFNFICMLLCILAYFLFVFRRLVLTMCLHKSGCTNTPEPAYYE